MSTFTTRKSHIYINELFYLVLMVKHTRIKTALDLTGQVLTAVEQSDYKLFVAKYSVLNNELSEIKAQLEEFLPDDFPLVILANNLVIRSPNMVMKNEHGDYINLEKYAQAVTIDEKVIAQLKVIIGTLIKMDRQCKLLGDFFRGLE